MAGRDLNGPNEAVAITPSDTADNSYKIIYVGGAGNIALQASASGSSVIFTGVPVGTQLNIHTSKVLATGTTATLLIGMR